MDAETDPRKAFCDLIAERAATMMLTEGKAPFPMMIDRLLTFTVAQICAQEGSPRAAEVLREMAAKVEDGIFHSVTGEAAKH